MAKDVKLAAAILDTLEGLPDVRRGLKIKPRYDAPLVLEVGAFEGDYDGGTGHGNILIPLVLADKILDTVEGFLRDELKRLNVKP